MKVTKGQELIDYYKQCLKECPDVEKHSFEYAIDYLENGRKDTLHKKVRGLREELVRLANDMSDREIGERLGIHKTYVSQIIRRVHVHGNIISKADYLRKVAQDIR